MGNGFVNPYNFIEFPPKKAEAYTDTDKHTGYISYTITTKTPLFIPNSSSETAFRESDTAKDHKSYDFFSYTDLETGKYYENEYHVPVIPGSEMRGVVRNVYETLTDSCMGLLNEDEYPVKRNGVMFRPGLLKREGGKYSLCEATSSSTGSSPDRKTPPKGFEGKHNGEKDSNGYLIKWGMGVRKKHYHRYQVNTDNYGRPRIVKKDFSKDALERKIYPLLKSYLEQPAIPNNNEQAYKEYQADFENFLANKGGEYFPINYSKEGNLLYLAPAVFSKEVAEHSIGNLAGTFAPCKSNHCPACTLFGYVGKESAASTKIRFTDLQVVQELDAKAYYAKDKITIEALGGPKLGNVDFYLKKPEGADFWTYDYYTKNGQLKEQGGVLRGRKYYWHHSNFTYRPAKADKLNKTIRPVKPGISFSGKLYYEGISNKQLKQLIWILNSGKENLGLMMGSAKPFGYGSVQCHVDEVEERTIALNEGIIKYDVISVGFVDVTYENAGFSTSGQVKAEFYKIAGLNSVPKDIAITYPRNKDQKDNEVMTEGFKWFANNHSKITKRRTDAKIYKALPRILDADITLVYNEDPPNSGGQNKGGYGGNSNYKGNGNRNNNGRNGNNYRRKSW